MQNNKNKILLVSITLALALASQIQIQSANAGFFDGIIDKITKKIWTDHMSESSGDTEKDEKPGKIAEPSPIYAPTVDYEEAVVSAVEKGLKSVVSVVVSKDIPILEKCIYDPFGNLAPEFDDFFKDFKSFYTQCPSDKTEKKEVGGGSGFVVSEDGMILTNKHVINDEKADYTVVLNNGDKYKAKILARDPVQDIAILKIDKVGLSVVTLGNSSSIRLGQTAIAIGNALGKFKNTVSVGVVSGLSRSITASGGGFSEEISDVIQTDAAINPGNSGGPLLNLRGEVIGVNVAVAQDAQGIGFAIPIDQAKRAIESVKRTGTIKAPFIGVRYLMITKEIAEKQGLISDYGALVRGSGDGPGVVANSPAEKAGLLAEDIILEVDGEKLSDGKTLVGAVQKYSVGDTVTLKVMRAGKILTLQLVLGERPGA